VEAPEASEEAAPAAPEVPARADEAALAAAEVPPRADETALAAADVPLRAEMADEAAPAREVAELTAWPAARVLRPAVKMTEAFILICGLDVVVKWLIEWMDELVCGGE